MYFVHTKRRGHAYHKISVFSVIIDTVNESDTLVEELVGGGITTEQTQFLELFVAGGVQELVEDVVIPLGFTLMDDTILFQQVCIGE